MEYYQYSDKNLRRQQFLRRKKRRQAMMRRRRRFFASLLIIIIASCFFIFRGCEKNETNKTNPPNEVSSQSQTPLQSKPTAFTVCIDPGHGGDDTGAVSYYNSILEKDVALNVSLLVGKKLSDSGINVIYTRKNDDVTWTDQKDSLDSRCKISNDANADLFVSIHCNFYKDSSDTNGFEVYCDTKNTPDEKLAQMITDKMVVTSLKNRGVKDKTEKELRVLNTTKATSVLIELGFLSNVSDTIILKTPKNQEIFATSISDAIIEYKNSIDQ